MSRKRVWPVERITLTKESLVSDVKRLAKESETNPAAWITELVEDFIKEHRSNKPFVGDPDRHTERHDEFDCDEYSLDPYALEVES